MKAQLNMKVLAALLLGQLTCAAVSALTAPSCTVKQGETVLTKLSVASAETMNLLNCYSIALLDIDSFHT